MALTCTCLKLATNTTRRSAKPNLNSDLNDRAELLRRPGRHQVGQRLDPLFIYI